MTHTIEKLSESMKRGGVQFSGNNKLFQEWIDHAEALEAVAEAAAAMFERENDNHTMKHIVHSDGQLCVPEAMIIELGDALVRLQELSDAHD